MNKINHTRVNVNPNSSHVAKQSSNTTNPNSSVTYLNVNNNPSNTNSNISSQLLTVDLNNYINVTIFSTIALAKK